LRDRKLKVADALLPKCGETTEADRESIMRIMIEQEITEGSQWLVANGFPTGIKMEDGKSPVDWSVIRNNEESLEHLLKIGFPQSKEQGIATSLEHAITSGASAKVVGSLITYGADQNAFALDNTPLLHKAILECKTEVVSAMINETTDINIKNALEQTALYRAVQSREMSKVVALVEAGADLSSKFWHGSNYLHITMSLGDYPRVTSYLVEQGLDPQDKNDIGYNALESAAIFGRVEASKALIEVGAKLSSEFSLRKYKDGRKKALATLFASGQDSPDGVLPNGDTYLIDSVKNKRYDMMEFLIAQGAEVNKEGHELEPPLAFAVAVQDIKATRILLKSGAEVNFEFKKPISESFKNQIVTDGAIKFFLEKDSQITPIMMACDQANMDLCMLLRSYGARETATKKYRFSAGGLAARRKKTDIVQLMLGAVPGNRDRTVLVDLSSQRATVYDKDKKTVMSFKVSSGKKGKETKRGTFVVTNKKRHHVSSIYDTEMPYFQRLSYSDFGFHTGYVPGYPASSGCIRCPDSYARKLFYYLKVGDVVTIQW